MRNLAKRIVIMGSTTAEYHSSIQLSSGGKYIPTWFAISMVFTAPFVRVQLTRAWSHFSH